MIPQDLHIHTVYSSGDSAVVKEQTIQLIKQVQHAHTIGISDHYEYLVDEHVFDQYSREVRTAKFRLGTEINGHPLVSSAIERPFDYFVYHCSRNQDYMALERLIATGKPVIVAHPLFLGTDLDRVPSECYIEINNRYIWRSDWLTGLRRFARTRKFVISSDAHQPNWLNQNAARFVAGRLGIREHLLFVERETASFLRYESSLN